MALLLDVRVDAADMPFSVSRTSGSWLSPRVRSRMDTDPCGSAGGLPPADVAAACVCATRAVGPDIDDDRARRPTGCCRASASAMAPVWSSSWPTSAAAERGDVVPRPSGDGCASGMAAPPGGSGDTDRGDRADGGVGPRLSDGVRRSGDCGTAAVSAATGAVASTAAAVAGPAAAGWPCSSRSGLRLIEMVGATPASRALSAALLGVRLLIERPSGVGCEGGVLSSGVAVFTDDAAELSRDFGLSAVGDLDLDLEKILDVNWQACIKSGQNDMRRD